LNELAIKALNQYRQRDVLPYLALRYYLSSSAGRQNRWIEDVCTRLATDEDKSSYLKTYHFKDYIDGSYHYRYIYIPSANEILAEVALISEISKYKIFQPKNFVYSYRFSDFDDKSGVFKPYFYGLQERQKSIAKACKENKTGIVLYTDIKKFYPSIPLDKALKVWEDSCTSSSLDNKFKNLGTSIIKKHGNVSARDRTGQGILTGPLFSHVIANLLLDEIDIKMAELSQGKYWRYVDDIVFLGSEDDLIIFRNALESELSNLNLKLHTGNKDFKIPCNEWLSGEHDFNNSFGIKWISLIANVKRFLLAHPYQVGELRYEFNKHNIRIPVLDYSNVVQESGFLKKMQDWLGQYTWAKKQVRVITIKSLVSQAEKCRNIFSNQLNHLLNQNNNLTLYERKRLIPKLRYLTGRLLYLLNEDTLKKIFPKLEIYPELYLIAKVTEAVATKDLSKILPMGINATQIASQLLKVNNNDIFIKDIPENSEILDQSLAIVEINGLKHPITNNESEIFFLGQAKYLDQLMNSESDFIQELACLHGFLPSRHKETLDSSFDRDEELALDLLSQIQSSNYF
jgi:hypothetical protein